MAHFIVYLWRSVSSFLLKRSVTAPFILILPLVTRCQPKLWQWFGCVCHRRAEWTIAERKDNWWNLGHSIGLHDDECPKGTVYTEADQGFHRSYSCFIGIIGWLLSCRSACIDGLQALLSTSTFHVFGLDLLLHLPELIYPRFLQHITSMELLWVDHGRYLEQHPLGKNTQRTTTSHTFSATSWLPSRTYYETLSPGLNSTSLFQVGCGPCFFTIIMLCKAAVYGLCLRIIRIIRNTI
ncbi:hypothetical protein ED733_000627 [Metarhizium rileyi]|uniref:Uncharacterized protein n=1 Tax=Metarhizium rileyi (strain RCEF 4871) TaxID=1649241 RepID=A0A5C6G2F5_METRR|nr:hypothetical protein ED733_000627 [Metarhizium rileyi]